MCEKKNKTKPKQKSSSSGLMSVWLWGWKYNIEYSKPVNINKIISSFSRRILMETFDAVANIFVYEVKTIKRNML